jgi:hypothetical protein
VELKEFQKVLDRFADDVNNAAKRELGSRRIGKNRSYGVASRSLQKSLTYSITDGQVLFGSPNPSAPFIHWGVNGTRKKRGAPFSYTTKQPPVDAVLKWMKVKPVRLRNEGGQFIKQTESRLRSAAFLIARSIKRKGIEGLRYYIVALETIVPKYNEEFGEAVVSDILKSLTFDTGNIKIKFK